MIILQNLSNYFKKFMNYFKKLKENLQKLTLDAIPVCLLLPCILIRDFEKQYFCMSHILPGNCENNLEKIYILDVVI